MTIGQYLLNKAIEAHAGFYRWQTIKEMVPYIRCGGVALPLRFKFVEKII